MTDGVRYSESTLGWLRKPGPLRVWRVVEGRKKTVDGKTLRFSIQEVPEDRHVDALDHMCTIFLRDEVICHHTDVINNPKAVADFRRLWNFALQQGIVVGAFLVDENNPKPPLAGVNTTLVKCEAAEKGLTTGIEVTILRLVERLAKRHRPFTYGIFFFSMSIGTLVSDSWPQLTSEISQRIFRFMAEFEKEHDARKLYGVEEYITAFGLSVDPDYRGQGLGFHLLKARDEMSVAYDIRATTTVFTAVAAQKVAAQADFDLLLERKFGDIKNADGSEMFPGIGEKPCKLMGKRFRDAKKSTPDN